ncbi:MAG: hypothetical protein AAB342_03940 [Chloroflexota bacterium]
MMNALIHAKRSAFILHPWIDMLNNNRGSEASEKVVVLAIVAATVLTILYTIYTTLGTRLTALLNNL